MDSKLRKRIIEALEDLIGWWEVDEVNPLSKIKIKMCQRLLEDFKKSV